MRPASGKRIGTLFTNPGGPGVSGVDFLRSGGAAIFDQDLLDHYDLVAWDPRGVGASAPVDCYGTRQLDEFLFSDPDLPEGSAALRKEVVDDGIAFGKACPFSGRGPGIPVWPWWGHLGVGLDTGGVLEALTAALVLPAALAWQSWGLVQPVVAPLFAALASR